MKKKFSVRKNPPPDKIRRRGEVWDSQPLREQGVGLRGGWKGRNVAFSSPALEKGTKVMVKKTPGKRPTFCKENKIYEELYQMKRREISKKKRGKKFGKERN